ncbi:MAG: hypothetical protein ACI906_004678 [Candidatus Latescibacterota bacterium]|jgi:hypothetical protein
MSCIRTFKYSISALVLCALYSVSAPAQQPSEHQIKAAFLFNFANFVQWPTAALTDTTTLTIGILGDDPFGNAFTPFERRKIKGHSLRIVRSTRLQELPICHVLFISTSEEKHLEQIFQHLKDRPVLTVSETPGFARTGGMINFVLQDKRVRFEINLPQTREAKLKLSSKLLKLALVIDDVEEGQD